MQKIITPLPIQLGNKTAGVNRLALYLNPNRLLGGNSNPTDGTPITTGANAWKDLSGNSNEASQGTVINQPVFKTNIANGNPMVLFDGSNDGLNISAATSINDLFVAGGTIVTVIKPITGNNGRLFQQGNDINSYLRLVSDSAGTCKLDFRKGFSGTFGRWETTNLDITLNALNIIAVTYNGSSVANDPAFYVNSPTPKAVTEQNTPVGTSNTSTGTIIGSNSSFTATFNGYIGDMMLFQRVLTASEIEQLFIGCSNKYNITLS